MGNNRIGNIFKKKKQSIKFSDKEIPKRILRRYNDTRQKEHRRFICNAPFTSLRFNLKGQVLVCCYNRTYVLGNYPFDSLKAIWEGDKLKELQRNIKERKLNLGCQICREQIVNEYFSSVKTKLYDDLMPIKDFPLLLEFELENTCNLECIMCNGEVSSKIREKEGNNSISKKIYDRRFLEIIKPYLSNIQRANFIGGEPFLIPMYYEIVNEILTVNSGAIIHFSTNGTILNDRIRILLEKGNFEISMSVDSINKQTYEEIRRNASFELTFFNLKYFHDYCKRKNTNFCIWVCPLTVNRFEIPEIFEYFNRMNVSVYLNSVMDPQNLRIANLEMEELERLKNYYKSFVFISKTKVSLGNHSRFNDFVNQIDEYIEDKKNILEFLKDYQDIEQIRSFMMSKLEPYVKECNEELSINLILDYDEVNEKINEILRVFNDIGSLHEILVSFNYYATEEIVHFFKENSKHIICEYLKNKVVSIKS
jgi:MoaA/NifB/PqqE/SkfB family radical SAM enzyme